MDFEVTTEMIEAVSLAQLYKEDPILALRKAMPDKKLNSKEMQLLYKQILEDPRLDLIKSETIKLEKASLIDEDIDTIMLYYNKLLKDAQFEKKYEVVTRILKEIRQLKAIENEQMKFEVVFKIEKE